MLPDFSNYDLFFNIYSLPDATCSFSTCKVYETLTSGECSTTESTLITVSSLNADGTIDLDVPQ